MIRHVLCLLVLLELVKAQNLKQDAIITRHKRRLSDDGQKKFQPTFQSDIDKQIESTIEGSISDRNGDYDPCAPFEPMKPNFSGSNRRVCEIKCYEYIWEIRNRDVRSQRSIACDASRFIFPVLSGRDTSRGEFPHMAAIGWKATTGTWIFKCGGSLISSKFVLSAGHCIRASSLDSSIADTIPKIIRLGDKNIGDNKFIETLVTPPGDKRAGAYLGQYISIAIQRGNAASVLGTLPQVRDLVHTFNLQVLKNSQYHYPVDVNISRIIPHPSYRSPKKYYDIALFELEKEVEFTRDIHPACLWTQFDVKKMASTKGTVTGWGVVKSGSVQTSPELQAAEVDIIDSGMCDQLLRTYCNRHWCGLNDHQLCAGTLAGGADTCQGDSGGPLQFKIGLPPMTSGTIYHVFGITSFGYQCGRPNSPGIYTRVSSFLDWIESVVWPEDFSS